VPVVEETATSIDESKHITFAVAGDSLTAWDNETFPHWSGELDPITWTYWAMSPTMELVGGYARGFATAEDVAANIIPVEADVLVIMVSTNDLGESQVGAILDNVELIVATAGVSKVLVSAIPPFDQYGALANLHNDALLGLANERNWAWVDPWFELRDGTSWVEGFSNDGVHPTADGAKLAAEVIVAAVRGLVG
jgi:lysophospholipase L1-like esterase